MTRPVTRADLRRIKVTVGSRLERMIVEMLAEAGELYGLEMVTRSGGRLKRGTIYTTLCRMEEKGLVESYLAPPPEPGRGPTRRLYRVTKYGRLVHATWKTLARTFGLA